MATQRTEKKDDILDSLDAQPDDVTDLAVMDEQQVAVSTNVYSTETNFDQGDLWVSKIRLAQGLTPEVQSGEAKPGDWVLTGMPATKSPVVVPLAFAKLTRRFGIVGNDRYVACNRHQGDPNVDCPNCRVQYQEELRSNPGFPSTVENYYSYVVYSVDTEMPAVLEFARTGMGAGRLLNTFLMAKGGMAQFAVKLGGTQVQGKKGSYWQPTVSMTQVDDSVLERARELMSRAL